MYTRSFFNEMQHSIVQVPVPAKRQCHFPLSLLFSLLCIDDCLCCYCSCAIPFYSFSVMFMSSHYLTITSSRVSLFLECMYKLGKHLYGCMQAKPNLRETYASKPPAYAAVKCKPTLTQKLSQGSIAVSTKLTSSAIYHMLSLFLFQRIVFSSLT